MVDAPSDQDPNARPVPRFDVTRRLNVRHVECFRTVMAVGTVTAAAELLNTSQPAISRSIQQFEDAIGLRLFDRVRRRLIPTAAARALYDEVRKTFLGIDHIASVAANLKTFQSGNISIVCAPAFSVDFISEVATRFLQRHRLVSLSVEVQQATTIAEWINGQRFDLGLADYPLSPPGAEAEVFAEPDEVCILPAGHRLAKLEIIRPEDLAGLDFVYLDSGDPYRWRLDKMFDDAAIPRRMVAETPNSAAVCALVRKGAGVSIVNPFTALDFVDRGLVMRPFSEKLPFNATLLRAKHRPSSPLISLFIQQLKETRDQYLTRASSALG